MKTDIRTKQAKTWLTPSGVQQLRNVALTAEVPTHLQDRNRALVGVLYDTGLRSSEAAQLNVEYLDLEAETATVYLPGEIQKRLPKCNPQKSRQNRVPNNLVQMGESRTVFVLAVHNLKVVVDSTPRDFRIDPRMDGKRVVQLWG